MTVLEYLQRKYNNPNPSSILQIEAYIFNIPFPTETGWIKKHGSKKITSPMAILLRNYFKNRPDSSNRMKFSIRILNEFLGTEPSKPQPKKTKQHRPIEGKKHVVGKQPTESSVVAFIHNSPVDPTSDSFLKTFDWAAIRKMALNLHGSSCQCCGASPKTGVVPNVDHIKPRKFFPELALDIDNLQVLCGDCNRGKGNWDMTDSRPI